MSSLSIANYFPFGRVKITRQSVSSKGDQAWIEMEPDARFRPVCYICGSKSPRIHSKERRILRDLDLARATVQLNCMYRKVSCPQCNRTTVEDLGFFQPYRRVTRRLERYIYELCQMLTVRQVADHLGLNWKTVKEIDKRFLEEEYGQTNYEGLRILAVDEIAIHKGHSYMTVVLDYLSGRVVWMAKDRKAETLMKFFDGMTEEQKQQLEAIAMDMWDPFILAVEQKVPHVKIVFDLFHVVSSFNKVIDKVRNTEYRKASEKDKAVIKGTKYLLLKNRKNVRKKKDRAHLKQLLKLNETINSVMILKDKLKHIWSYRHRTWAKKAIDEWCDLAYSIEHPDLTKFAKSLIRHSYGILNHCDYGIHTGSLEGTNNKIKVIKRKAYGYHDTKYFSLKVIQAFAN